MSETTEKTRLHYLDLAKGISLIFIILYHIGLPTYIAELVATISLVVFFISSGLCFRNELESNEFVKTKTKKLLIPYFSFGAMLVFGFYTVSGFQTDALILNIKELVFQRRYTTLWFIGILYFGIVIFYSICKLTKNNIKLVCIISTIISVIFTIYDNYIRIPLFWNIDTALIIQVYLAFGYLCYQKKWDKKLFNLSSFIRIIIFVILFGLTNGLLIINKFLGFEEYQLFYCQTGCYPLTVTASITGSIAVFIFSSLFDFKYITYVGRNSLTFFALHQTIFIELMYIIYGALGIDYKSPVGHTELICKITTFIGTIILCTIMDYIIRHTKLKIILG